MTVFSKVDAKCSDALHPWTTSCSFTSLEIFYHVFRTSFKIYGTLYLVRMYQYCINIVSINT